MDITSVELQNSVLWPHRKMKGLQKKKLDYSRDIYLGYVWLVPKFSLSIFWQPDILVSVWLAAKILVAYGILPTLLTFPSQILPTFWPTWD
jgi:hypothetical protein